MIVCMGGTNLASTRPPAPLPQTIVGGSDRAPLPPTMDTRISTNINLVESGLLLESTTTKSTPRTLHVKPSTHEDYDTSSRSDSFQPESDCKRPHRPACPCLPAWLHLPVALLAAANETSSAQCVPSPSTWSLLG